MSLPACVLCFAALAGTGSSPGGETLVVEVRSGQQPVAGARVRVAGVEAETDAAGRARLPAPLGTHEVTVEADGYLPASARVAIDASCCASVALSLEPLREELTVTSARSTTRLADQPLRVEMIDREEIEEKALMTPGSVAMLLGETTGLRVQTTAPSLGAANVRIQGLRGHYAQLLADGLPLYGAQGDSLSLLQVPPLDLGQVEVIKGVASALYGASALGGVVNLVSRRPHGAARELLLNATTLAGIDASGFVAGGESRAVSVIGGYHGQRPRDVDGDGWSDVAGYDRGLLRPRLFMDDTRGGTLLATAGFTAEDRDGGTLGAATAPDGLPFEESLATRHADLGLVAKRLLGRRLLSLRGSFSRTGQDRRFGAVRERGVRVGWFGEASLTGSSGRHTWVAGTAFQHDSYDARELPRFDYAFATPALFAQDEVALGERLLVAASARADFHSEYGTLASPRLSLLARPSPRFTIRASLGTGAFAPTPFNEETDETGLTRLGALAGLRAETALGGSLDATYRRDAFEATATLFGSRVAEPAQLRAIGAASVALVNAAAATRTWGSELLLRYRRPGFQALLTHAFTRSSELDPGGVTRREVPLTPRHTGSLNLIWEQERVWSLGFEAYLIGRQALEDDPYRAFGRAHLLVGALGQRRFGRCHVFLNLENLFDVRQTRSAPLLLPARRPDGRWTVDAWGPLDGRVLNGGVRLTF